MPPTIQLLEEDETTTTLRMPKGLADYIIHIQTTDLGFDLDFREHSRDELTREMLMKADKARKSPKEQRINI